MSDPGSGPQGPPSPAPASASLREAVAIGVGFALAFGGLAWWMSRPEAPASPRFEKAAIDPGYASYVGDRSCLDCHPGESAAHSRSGHARTLRPAAAAEAARRLEGRESEDPERPGVAWRFAAEAGHLHADRVEAGAAERYPIEYALGSGRHATTFVSLLGRDRDPDHPTSLEHRLTVFAHAAEPGLTPGQGEMTHAPGNTPHGRVRDARQTAKCFGCHVTALSDRGPTVLDEATMIPNVSCERCHGPARAHVEAARRGASGADLAMPPGEAAGSADRQMRLCGECHRLPEMGPPGETTVENAAIVRHQPVGLMQSACYKGSGGKLGCVTCHDPHARTSTDRGAYEATCLSCHGPEAPAHPRPCPVSPGEGCVACHMPRRDVGAGMIMSDHWIRIVPGAKAD